MKYSEQIENNEVNQALAEEMAEAARARQIADKKLKTIQRIIKIIAAIIIVVATIFITKPLWSGVEIRNHSRKTTVDSVLRVLDDYKTNHRNSLPKEASRRHWQDEFVKNYVSGKDFAKVAGGDTEYEFDINYGRSVDEILAGSNNVLYVDQSNSCGEKGEIVSGAGTAVAAIRIKLEPNEIYCKDNK